MFQAYGYEQPSCSLLCPEKNNRWIPGSPLKAFITGLYNLSEGFVERD